MRQGNTSEVQVIGLFVGGPGPVFRPRSTHRGPGSALAYLRGHLLAHGDEIIRRKAQRVLPQDAIVANIDCLAGSAAVLPNLLIMPGHDAADMHFFSGLLQVDIAVVYLP